MYVIKEKRKSCFLNYPLCVASKASQNLNITCTFYLSTMKLRRSGNFKKIWAKKSVNMPHMFLKLNLYIFQW